VSCSKKGDTTPSGGNSGIPAPAPGSGAVFTTDLNTELTNIGNSKVSNGVILARIASGNMAAAFTAVQVACTHEGTSIAYNQGQGIFICPNHGSQFNTNGQVLLGPATNSLQKFTVNVTNNIATVAA